ncbi:hypothetical protein D3C72_546200 [compost metagenome]
MADEHRQNLRDGFAIRRVGGVPIDAHHPRPETRMATFIEQVIGHQAFDRRLDRVVACERRDITGHGVFGDGHADQFDRAAQVLWRQRYCRRNRPAQFDFIGELNRFDAGHRHCLLHEIHRHEGVVILVDHHGHRVVTTGKREGHGEAILGDAARGLVDDLGLENHHVVDEFVQRLYQGEITLLRALAQEGFAEYQRLTTERIDQPFVVFEYASRAGADGRAILPGVGKGLIVSSVHWVTSANGSRMLTRRPSHKAIRLSTAAMALA